MKEKDILNFVKKNIEPLNEYGTGSPIYRCSVTLKDGLILPCVIIKNAQPYVDLAIRRFQECLDKEPKGFKKIFNREKEKNLLFDYHSIVNSFVCSGNSINYYEIENITESDFAIPHARMSEIKGETSMGWTQFTAKMKDDKEFEFGTTFDTAFFNMPKGYVAKEISKIIPAERGSAR